MYFKQKSLSKPYTITDREGLDLDKIDHSPPRHFKQKIRIRRYRMRIYYLCLINNPRKSVPPALQQQQ